MSFMDVMYGPLGQVNNQFQANLGQNAAAMGQQQNYYNQVANIGAQNQQAFNQAVDNSKGPSSGYGTVGGYPSFGDPAAPGTYSPGSGNSSFSGTSLGGSKGGGYPAGKVESQPIPDIGSGQSFDDRYGNPSWSQQPPTTFDDRWGSTPYAPTYQVPDIITDGGHPTFDQRWQNVPDYNPYSTPQMPSYPGGGGSLGYAGGASKGGWDPSKSFEQQYSSDPYGSSGGPSGLPYGPGYFDNTFGAANSQPQGLPPGQPYGPGYFDNTFGSANDMQGSRDSIAKAWMNQQMAGGDSRYTQGGNIYTFGAPGSGTIGGATDTFSGWDYQRGTPGGFDQRYYAPPAPMSYNQGVDELARLYNEVLGSKGYEKSSGTLNPNDIMIPYDYGQTLNAAGG